MVAARSFAAFGRARSGKLGTLRMAFLTRAESEMAGRAYAAYGGVYIAASMIWMWLVEGSRPDRWDIAGILLCLLGSALILLPSRS